MPIIIPSIRTITLALLCSGLMASCHKEASLSEGGKDLFNKNGDIPLMGVTIGSNTNTTYGSYANLLTGEVYAAGSTKANAAGIDLIFQNSGTTAANFLTPASASLNAFPSTFAIVSEWEQINNGRMIRLRSTALDEAVPFDSISTRKQLLDAYDAATTLVTSIPGYNAVNDGPADRVRSLQKGELVFYRSADKQLTAIIRITSIVTGNAGSMAAEIKSANATE